MGIAVLVIRDLRDKNDKYWGLRCHFVVNKKV